MPTIRQTVRRSGRLTALARGVRDAIRGAPAPGPRPRPRARAAAAASRDGLDGVAELHRVAPKRDAAPAAGPRLNLLVPTLSPARAFGGTRTALDLFEALAASLPAPEDRRVPADPGGRPRGPRRLRAREPRRRGRAGSSRRRGAARRRRRSRSSRSAAGDVFLATFWTTAELAARLVRWQAATFGGEPRPYAYLIQDFEPGFYPWSAQSELARATYAGDVPMIAVINSGLLRGLSRRPGHPLDGEFTFEPRIDARAPAAPRRAAARARAGGSSSTAGRETPRNAFPLLVDGLRAWVAGGGGGGWEVVSAGRSHPPVELGGGLRMRSVGKLDDRGVRVAAARIGARASR